MRFIALLHLLSFALRHTSPNDRYYLGKQRPNFQAINPKRHFRECYYKPGLKMGSGSETVYHIRRLFLLSDKMPVFCTIKADGQLVKNLNNSTVLLWGQLETECLFRSLNTKRDYQNWI